MEVAMFSPDLFVQNYSEKLHFNSTLQEAIRKLYYHNYFSYLSNAHQLKHWGLMDTQLNITQKGIRFCRGEIAVEKVLFVSPRHPNDPDPDILRSDTYVFYAEDDVANT